MKYIHITNEGEVEAAAFTLLGASSKRGQEGKIGMFGSGNKYALAYLLRNEFEIEIFSGETKIEIGVVQQAFRDQSFGVITVNGKETSITTETGPKWTFWQAIRELYSNAIDEGRAEIDYSTDPWFVPASGQTLIRISVPNEKKAAVDQFWAKKEMYFRDNSDFLFMDKDGRKILEGTDGTAYRKGIRCVAVTEGEKVRSIFNYDLPDVEINESRLVPGDYYLCTAMWACIYQLDNVGLIRHFLSKIDNEKDVLEYNSYGPGFMGNSLNMKWKEALKGKKVYPTKLAGWLEGTKDNVIFVPENLYDDIVRKLGTEFDAMEGKRKGDLHFTEIPHTPIMQNSIDKVCDFFDECSFPITKTIKFARFSGKNTKALVVDNEIYLSEIVVAKGLHEMANAIICSLAWAESDATGGLGEEIIVNQFLTYMKNANSINL